MAERDIKLEISDARWMQIARDAQQERDRYKAALDRIVGDASLSRPDLRLVAARALQ